MIEASPEQAPYRMDRAPWGWREIVIVFGVTVVALVAVFTAISIILRGLGLTGDLNDSPAGLTAQLVGQMLLDIIAVGAAAAFSLGKYGRRPSAWGLVWPPRLHVGLVFGVLVLCYGALIAYRLVVVAIGLEGFEPESNVPEGLFEFRAVVPLAVFLIVVIAPLFEEMFFRGFILQGLWSRFGFWPAALGSGFLFSLIHFTGRDTIGLIVPFTIIGVLFAWLVYRTGSLWNSIAVHFLFNLVSMIANLAQRMTQ